MNYFHIFLVESETLQLAMRLGLLFGALALGVSGMFLGLHLVSKQDDEDFFDPENNLGI